MYPCTCCGYLTLPVPQEQAIAYICPVCYWENDVFITSDDEPSDENHGMTLKEGMENYKKLEPVQKIGLFMSENLNRKKFRNNSLTNSGLSD